MPAELVFGPFSTRTYTVVLSLTIVAVVALTVRTWKRRGEWLDVCLGALAGGIVFARLFHVLLHWNYFADNPGEALRLNAGGLDWHGALVGGLLGLWVASRWRKLAFQAALDALTPALALLALGGWVGCLAAACGYGAEVDTLAHYSPLAVSEAADIFGIVAPRYNTQWFGIALALGLLLVSALLFWRNWLVFMRFWLVLALLSIGMLVIGFYRGDSVPLIVGLRADQWLDGMIAVIGIWRLAMSR